MVEWEDCSKLLASPSALRRRADEDGCLFFRSLVDRDAIRQVRREILGLCAEAGWIAPRTDPREGVAAPGVACVEGQPEYMAVYNQVMRLESFHALAHDAGLLGMFDELFGESTLVHPRNIARIVFPQNTRFTTPAHQDYVHIQGAEQTYTAWIPLGDCPRSRGSLAVMLGSHRAGVQTPHPADGAGGLGIQTDALQFPWATADFSTGDALIFSSLVIHKALPNLSANRIRLSVDYRYQPASAPIVQSSLEPHFGQVTWPEVYEGWRSDRYQYYWKDHHLHIADWSPEYHRAAAERG